MKLDLKRMILLDNHMGSAIPELKIDMDKYVKGCKEAGAQCITIMARDAHSCHYYDTKIGYKHPKMDGDLLREAVEAGNKHNVDIAAYYNTLCDHVISVSNPDYRQVTADGKPITGFDYYSILCMNSPYRDIVFAELMEIAQGYDVKGFFLDITYIWEGACYCEYCKKSYKEMYGVPMPDYPEQGSIECKREYEFKRHTRKTFLKEATSAIKSVKKDAYVTWNRSGYILRAEYEADIFADYTTTEMHPPSYFEPSLKCRWNRCRGKAFDLTVPYELGSWGDWTVAPVATLKSLTAIASSLGSSCSFGTDVYPSGKYAGHHSNSMLNTIGECFDWMSKREEWWNGAEKAPTAAIIYQFENLRNSEYMERDPQKAAKSLFGAAKMLQECGIDYDVLDNSIMPESLEKYELVVLPDQSYITKHSESAIIEYVKNGGKLIASGTSSLYNEDCTRRENFSLADVFGVDFVTTSPYSMTYIDEFNKISNDMPDIPILIKKPLHLSIRALPREDVEILAMQIDPAFEHKTYRHVYHQHAHPALPTPYPAVVLNKYGKGECIFIPVSIESSFDETGSPWLRNIYRNCIKLINPTPKLVVEGDPSIDVSLYKKEEKLILNLICLAKSRGDGRLEYIQTEPLAKDIKVKIKTNIKTGVYSVPDMTEIPFIVEDDGYISFKIDLIETGEVIVLE